MISRRYTSYLLLALIILGSLSVPYAVRMRLRSRAVALVSKSNTPTQREAELIAENIALKRQIQIVRQWLASEDQIDHLKEMRIKDLQERLVYHEKAICASVVFREPTAWSSYFWIDRGEGKVQPHSPVLVGDAIVGVIEDVCPARARVRLITDPNLAPSVEGPAGYAKGQVQGSGAPLWRSNGTTLKGVGFSSKAKHLEVGDLLQTTGFDGVFPPGLKVATVTKVYPCREGEVTYAIEAKPIVPKLHDIRSVQVLPPL